MATRRFLGRSIKFYVNTTGSTWVEMAHNGISITENVKEADLTTTADGGRNYSVPAERGTLISVSAKCLYDATSGAGDPAQAKLRTMNGLVDVAGIGNFRLDILGKIRREFSGWVKVEDLGADQNDGAPFNVEIHVVGTIGETTF